VHAHVLTDYLNCTRFSIKKLNLLVTGVFSIGANDFVLNFL
jgi:hypothetical protein